MTITLNVVYIVAQVLLIALVVLYALLLRGAIKQHRRHNQRMTEAVDAFVAEVEEHKRLVLIVQTALREEIARIGNGWRPHV